MRTTIVRFEISAIFLARQVLEAAQEIEGWKAQMRNPKFVDRFKFVDRLENL